MVRDAWGDVQSIPGSSTRSYVASTGTTEISESTSDINTESGDLVIEFGQLDDDGTEDSFVTQAETMDESLVSQDDQPMMPVDAADEIGSEVTEEESSVGQLEIVVDPEIAGLGAGIDGFTIGGNETPATSTEYRMDPEQFIEFDYSIIGNQTEEAADTSNASAEDIDVGDAIEEFATVETSAELPNENINEPVDDFEDPFTEKFEAEETVDPTYVPFVSAQNINSLMVTPEQLSMLAGSDYETPDRRGVSPEHSLVVVREPANADDKTQLELEIEAAEEKTLGSLGAIEKMREDIRRLQLELQSTQQGTDSEAAHPDFAVISSDSADGDGLETTADDASEITDEVVQEIAAIESTSSDGGGVDKVAESIRAELYSSRPLVEPTDGVDTDDRDIMIISQPEVFEKQEDDFADVEHLDTRISRGNAQRMDYDDLFRQLRATS